MNCLGAFNDKQVFTKLGAKHILVSLSTLSPQYRTKQLAMERDIIAAYRANNPSPCNYVLYRP